MVVPNGPETAKPRESAIKPAVAENRASWLANLAGLGTRWRPAERACQQSRITVLSRRRRAERPGTDARSAEPVPAEVSGHTIVEGLGSDGLKVCDRKAGPIDARSPGQLASDASLRGGPTCLWS